MQEPLLRPDIPDQNAPDKDRESLLTPISTPNYLYSFYTAIFLYILTISIFYTIHFNLSGRFFNFYTEDALLIAVQTLLIFILFLLVWLSLFCIYFIARMFKKARAENATVTWNRGPIRRLSLIYIVTTSVLGIIMIIVKFFSTHRWGGISLILAVFLLFPLVLYGNGPVLVYKILSAARKRQPGASFTRLTRYFAFEELPKEGE